MGEAIEPPTPRVTYRAGNSEYIILVARLILGIFVAIS